MFERLALRVLLAPTLTGLGAAQGILQTYYGHELGDRLAQVALVGDVDQDGVNDFVVGADGIAKPGQPSGGLVALYSGATFELIHPPIWGPTGHTWGEKVAGVGDFDGDGVPDFGTGAYIGPPPPPSVDGDGVPDYAAGATFCGGLCYSSERGYASILSGADHSLVRRIDGPRIFEWYILAHEFTYMDGGEDVNRDGIGDLIAGSPGANGHQDDDCGCDVHGMVEVFSGATGTRPWRFSPGVDGALLGDLDGDGLSEFTWGNDWDSSVVKLGGRITVFAGAPGDAHRVCTANPNSTGNAARLDLEGPISLSNNLLHLVIEGGVPNEAAIFFYGPEYVWQPFGDGVLCAGGGSLGLRRIGAPVVLDQDGMVVAPVDVTAPPMGAGKAAWTTGSTWVLQAWYRDPAGASGSNLTDAMQVTWTP